MWPSLAHIHARYLAHCWPLHCPFRHHSPPVRLSGCPARCSLLPPPSSCCPPWIFQAQHPCHSTRGYFCLHSFDLLDWVGALTSVVLWKSLLGCISLGVQGSPLCRMFAEDQFGKTSSRALVFTFQSTSVHTKFALVADISISDLWFRQLVFGDMC
ncbi:hypothetical protein FB45DRAFT_948604 [Roridomyces roridus]|uniref:Uncharacterized protein n=1 Tax=Roridomyces roridus TaxID=1738132 RepID=A0AAD7F9S4_9AGAR|nr:hypothetical protein FB45DRAFT_948604 [Roridomyces roridus]